MTSQVEFTRVLDALLTTSTTGSAGDIWAAFERELAALGLRSLHYESGLPRNGKAELCLKSDAPRGPAFGHIISQEFVETTYANAEFHEADGFIRHCEQSVAPIVYDTEACDDFTGPMQRLNNLVRDFDVAGGFIVPLRDFGRPTFGSLVYMFDRHSAVEMLRSQSGDLTALAHTFHGVLSEKLGGGKPKGGTELTPQETTCLGWVATGLTTKELAYRMDIATATANEYIAHACRKLGAATRAEAAAKAVSMGLINL